VVCVEKGPSKFFLTLRR